MKIIFKPKSVDHLQEQTFNLDDNVSRATIGRKKDNDFPISAKNVSSYHAVLQYENGRIFIEDLNSTNGLFINNRKITGKSEIVHGDKISFATVDFMVLFDLPSEDFKNVDDKQLEEPNGTVIIDQSKIPNFKQDSAKTGELQINLGNSDDDSNDIPSDSENQSGRSTVLFGMKNVLNSGRLIRIDDKLNPLNEYDLTKPETTIGRENCDITIEHSSISRFHSLVKRQPGNNYQLIDNDSTNGIFVNGKKLKKITLYHEDRVKIGDLEFVFLEPGKIFYKENLIKNKKSSSPINKKLLLIGGGVIIVLLLIIMLIPSDSSSGNKRKTAQMLTEKEIITQIHNSLENKSWDEVLDLISSFDVQGQEKAFKKATKEIKARAVYNEMNQALNEHNWNEAKALLNKIDKSTSYFAKGTKKYDSYIENYIATEQESIGNMVSEGNYNEAVEIAFKMASNFPENNELQIFSEEVKTKTASLKRKSATRQAFRRKLNKAKKESRKYLAEAKDNYLNGKIVEALTSIGNAKLSFEKININVPIKIKNTNKKMQQLRKLYFQGKKLMMQGGVDSASVKFEEVFALSKQLYDTNGVIEKEIMSLMSDYYLKKGKQFFNNGNFVKAYSYIDKVLSVNPSNSEARSLKRDISGKANKLYTNGYIEQTQYKDCKRALFYYKQVIELIPSSDPLYSKTLKRIKDCEK